MQPNLREWLRPYAGMTGAVVPVNARKKLDAIRKAAGLALWPKNGFRHSSPRTVWLRPTMRRGWLRSRAHSPQMLYSTYRELVLPEEAERYWKIVPATGADNYSMGGGSEINTVESHSANGLTRSVALPSTTAVIRMAASIITSGKLQLKNCQHSGDANTANGGGSAPPRFHASRNRTE